MAAAVGAAGFVATGGIVLPYARKKRAIAALRRRCREQRALALTFDDGPGQELTPQILELLAAHGVHATFFSLGRRARERPAMLDRCRAEGHEIGCHTEDHHNAWKSAPWVPPADIDRGYATLAPWVAPDGLFRPPHGKETALTRRALRRRGAPTGWWTVDSGDTYAELPPVAEIVGRVERDGGGVVLLHDHDAGRSPERVAHVLATTEALLRAARASGWGVVPLGTLSRAA